MKKIHTLLIITILFFAACTNSQKINNESAKKQVLPVNINTTDEAKALLTYLYEIKGNHILSGMHNYPQFMSDFTDSVYAITGKKPAVWSGDFGFSDERHPTDHIKYREDLVPEIIKQHNEGAIITLCYHQANPIEGEPCLFKPGVQYTLTEEQWQDLITPGTEVYNSWKSQMDTIAQYLIAIKEANIPILFRPYHEMNGSWFWWGGHAEEYKQLWIQLYEYYTNHHKLNNLLWVWSSDRPWKGVAEYYPGDEYVDVLGCDIYPLPDTNVVFRQEWYERIDSLAGNKPFALTEHSVLPTMEEFEDQPNYSWFVGWTNLILDDNSHDYIKEVFNSERVITLDELPWVD